MRLPGFLLPLFISAGIAFGGDEIPARKLALIAQAVESMHLRAQLEGFIQNTVAVKAKRIANDNPQLPDSVSAEIKLVIDSVYHENIDSGGNLSAALYRIFDKYLSEDDLKFATHYQASDAGQRFAKLAPRIAQEGLDAEQKWDEGLRPLIRERIRDRFPNLALKFSE